MLQITLEPQDQIELNPSQRSNDWDFKLKVVREGDTTELRISFEESHNDSSDNYNSSESEHNTLL